jgi:hypothetical protein
MAWNRKDHKVGDKFGHLVVISHVFERRDLAPGKRGIFWKCKCVCGKEDFFEGTKMRTGWVVSCGCVPRERKVLQVDRRINLSPPDTLRAYRLWKQMRSSTALKCMGYRDPSLAKWAEFYDFFAEMGPCPEDHKLGRKDLNKGFMPGNCIWSLKY